MALLESELVSGGILTQSGNKGDDLKIPPLTKLKNKIEKMEDAHRIADRARQIVLIQKNQEKLWKWLVKVVQKVGMAIVEHDLLRGATLASSK
ncbi:MAG: hypothetical protein QNJ54_23550 [Prochloraceae cyanobacterium]|nr:hypothetical protein [Prochloraceae cyanobacterium]